MFCFHILTAFKLSMYVTCPCVVGNNYARATKAKICSLFTLNLYLIQTIDFKMSRKQIPIIFLYEYKLGHKVMETTLDINHEFGQSTE
uniref:Uncharacterized protein n=1 Tax=Vespula pensylvanica TaxID=30213 RepID=A0A834JZP0_VESPE|nr:hypothetical protein H0235_016672 [Vespula pensylvanica]